MFTQVTAKTFAAAAATSLLALGTASAQTADLEEGSFITLTGAVEEAGTDSFVLDYGTGTIEVETEDLYDYNPDLRLQAGEAITVYGTVDTDFFEGRVLEAQSIYARSQDTYASVEDPMVGMLLFVPDRTSGMTNMRGTRVTLEGMVTNVSDDSFTLNTGDMSLDVMTAELGYDPLDDIGAQRIDSGDRVIVSGMLEDSLFSDMMLDAQAVTTLAAGGETQSDRQAQRDRYRERMQRERSMQMTENRNDRPMRSSRAPSGEMEFTVDEFDALDRNGDGVVTRGEYVRVAAGPDNITRTEARRLFNILARGDREMTQQEFLNPPQGYQDVSQRVLQAED